MRLYLPMTLPDLAAGYAAGGFDANLDAVVSEAEGEEAEYAALMTAADSSAEMVADLADGLRRRVVVVAQLVGDSAQRDAPVRLRDVVAVHVDPSDDADPDDDLAWYATQEIDSLLTGLV